MQAEAKALIHPFLQWQRDRFVFFKYASRLNGSIDKGYISGELSLKQVHALRDKIDLLIIGGQTVRADRPTLDSRLVGGKAPDILILSKQQKWDKSIPLFQVPSRKVMIGSLEDIARLIQPYRFIMIEGTDTLMSQLCYYIDYYLIYIAPTMQQGANIYTTPSKRSMQFLHVSFNGTDIQIWATDRDR